MTRLPISVGCLLLGGCAVAYQSSSWWRDGGWSETRLAPDQWRVRYQGNANTDAERVLDFSMLRAATLCGDAGFSHFLVVETKTELEIVESEESETEIDKDGNEYETTSDSTQRFPAAIRRVQCLPADLGQAEVLRVQFVGHSIRQKYGL